MDKLIDTLKILKNKLQEKYDLSDNFLNQLLSVYPFNKFEYVISHLLAEKIIELKDYLDIRQEYIVRNKFLHLFEITAPRNFGETWAQNHLNELVQELQRPSNKLDSAFNGEYDFWYDKIKIEVKASRAVKRKSGDSLVDKALAFDSAHGFDMNFQQIKPRCCDVFVWIGVWRDVIKYWILSSADVENNIRFSKGQHRGNVGEGQLWITEKNIKEFEQFLVVPRDILQAIITRAINK